MSDFEHFAKNFVCSGQNSQGIAESCQTFTIDAWMAFPGLKAKMVHT